MAQITILCDHLLLGGNAQISVSLHDQTVPYPVESILDAYLTFSGLLLLLQLLIKSRENDLHLL